ncbi:hypothetical protein RclHR1_00090040 [Rhizophagus clarus]|uniref:Uncharacterized protein n=1 Tax=Rhizophagus clarus TaxID=94130 RepID=A0A2Z6S2Y0_9GLOM|nr:hypothetical protein RclHR1_00090040 [Rhizophagus clarus]GES90476.1 hypothetical protein GLOIN_2v1772032 [Rhizophagus clarus]
MTYVSQDNVIAEYSFFYKAWNDLQIYHVICKEISFEVVSHLLSNNGFSTQNYVQLDNLHVFYHQQPEDKKIYQITCELASYKFIIDLLNKINYGIEIYDQRQEYLNFSRECKENLEFYLKQDLVYYLPPNKINKQLNMNDNGTSGSCVSDANFINTSQHMTYYHQDNGYQLISQNITDFTQHHQP